MIQWQLFSFKDFSTFTLYELLRLRVNIFVVEQNCPYPELDNKDPKEGVYHLLGLKNNEIIAASRLLPSGISYQNPSIGRLVIRQDHRKQGLGDELLTQSLVHCNQLWPNQSIDISAQAHLKQFYSKQGFIQISGIYLEDNIPHLQMRLNK